MFKRYCGTYFLLLTLPFPLTLIPGLNMWLEENYSQLWIKFFHVFNDHFWHLQTRTEMTGSGDALDNYFTVAVLALIALPVAVAWKNFARCKPWVDALIRWNLALMLFSYGFTKLGQFPPPHVLRLHEPFGQASPMGLLWTFMGASRAYTFFAGVMEVSAGVLLLIPRAQTIGAALALGVMSNVFMLNMCYDVPVKLFSFQLCLFAVWCLGTDFSRVWNFVRGAAVAPLAAQTNTHLWWAQNAAILLMAISIARIFPLPTGAKDGPYQGTWAVETPGPWQRMVFYRKSIMMLQNKAGGLERFMVEPQKPDGTYRLQKGVAKPTTVTFENVDPTHLILKGEINGEQLELRMAQEPEIEFPLMTRGFHWVNETPYNN